MPLMNVPCVFCKLPVRTSGDGRVLFFYFFEHRPCCSSKCVTALLNREQGDAQTKKIVMTDDQTRRMKLLIGYAGLTPKDLKLVVEDATPERISAMCLRLAKTLIAFPGLMIDRDESPAYRRHLIDLFLNPSALLLCAEESSSSSC